MSLCDIQENVPGRLRGWQRVLMFDDKRFSNMTTIWSNTTGVDKIYVSFHGGTFKQCLDIMIWKDMAGS